MLAWLCKLNARHQVRVSEARDSRTLFAWCAIKHKMEHETRRYQSRSVNWKLCICSNGFFGLPHATAQQSKAGSLHPDLSISSSNRRKRASVAKFVELVPRPVRQNQECNVVDHNITQTHMQRFNTCRFPQSRHACSVTHPLRRCAVA